MFNELENLQDKIKNQDARINILEEEIKELKQENKQFKEDNQKITRYLNILTRNHYNLVLWQAYKNLEYYIIQTATGFDNARMKTINTNLTTFLADEQNKDYKKTIIIMMEKFEISKYNMLLGKISRNRVREANPNPIELDELELACDDMKKIYPGIEAIYTHYNDVYEYFNIFL